MKRHLKWAYKHSPVLIGLAVSGALLSLALRDIRPRETARILLQAHISWLIPMALVILGDLWIRALRWRLLLPPIKDGRATVPQLWRLEAIGLAINNVVFLRMGELIRGYLAGKELSIPTLTALATIVIERALDMTALSLIFGFAAIHQTDIIPAVLGRSALLFAAALTLALAILSVSNRLMEAPTIARWGIRFPRLHKLLEQAIFGAGALKSWHVALRVGALSLSLWLVDAGLYWAGANAFGMGDALGYGRSVLILSTAAASCLVPAVPGSFGAFEGAIKTFLVRLNFDGTLALSYAGFVHVVNYLIVTILGIVFLYRTGHTLTSLKALKDQP